MGIRVGIEFRVAVVGLVVTRGFVVVGNLFEYLSTYSSTHNCGTERCFFAVIFALLSRVRCFKFERLIDVGCSRGILSDSLMEIQVRTHFDEVIKEANF